MEDKREVGAALRAALERRGCALQAAEARALALSLIDLICDGLITGDESEENCRTCNTAVLNTSKGGGRE